MEEIIKFGKTPQVGDKVKIYGKEKDPSLYGIVLGIEIADRYCDSQGGKEKREIAVIEVLKEIFELKDIKFFYSLNMVRITNHKDIIQPEPKQQDDTLKHKDILKKPRKKYTYKREVNSLFNNITV